VRPPQAASSVKTTSLTGGFHQWDDVKPEFLEDLFDTTHRNHPGFGNVGALTNQTGRNDFDTLKVARDADNIYFYVRTREPITAPTGDNWMLLYLDTDCDHKTGWEGYDFVIGRSRSAPGVCTIERNIGGWKWEAAAKAQYVVRGNEMQIVVPRKAVGLEKVKLKFDFKCADNVPSSGDAMDFVDKGDVAPNGRFKYRFAE
jgi:hypothetical protein